MQTLKYSEAILLSDHWDLSKVITNKWVNAKLWFCLLN